MPFIKQVLFQHNGAPQHATTTISKNSKAKNCSEYIGLIKHTLREFLRIIYNKIYKQIEEDVSDSI